MNRIPICFFLTCFFSVAHSQSADFAYQSSNGLYCTPSTIQFTQTCTGSPTGFIWDFGNGRKGYAANETATYNAAGTYTVKLTATFKDNILTTSKTIVVNAPVKPVINADRSYICLPGTINFTAVAGAGISKYEWNFGDGTAPLTTSSATTSHNYTGFSSDTVTLRATDGSGCYGDTSMIVLVKSPVVTANATPSRGCTPANVAFTADADIPVNSSVTSYNWDFNDGSPKVVTTTNKTNHIYPLPGEYTPKLTVTTSEGCTRIYSFQQLKFGIPPTNTVAYPVKPVICGSEAALLVAKGTNATRYYWTFGDGTFLSSTDTLVSHKFTTLGVKSVGVTIIYNECTAAYTRTKVTVIGVIANYANANTCVDKSAYSFRDTSQGNVSSRLWNFGDGTTLAATKNPAHTYPITGRFLSSLIVNDASTGCSDTASHTIYTAAPALTSAGNSVCKNDSVTFSITNNYTDTAITYTWHLLGKQSGPDSNAVTTVKASTAGSYDNFVVINRGPQFCLDTIRAAGTFLVGGVNMDFSLLPDLCFKNPVVITNNSKPFFASDTVKLWYWNYGNSLQNDSVFQPAPFEYANPGTYNVTLTARDKNGCEDTLSKTININPSPFVRITPKTDTICAGQPVTMIALSNDDPVQWSPASNLSCIGCDTTIAKPLLPTKYFATVTNAFNCSVRDSNFIKVNIPFTGAPVPGYASICATQSVTLDAMPKDKKIVWSPSAGLSDPTSYHPVTSPERSTIYTASLTDSAGCFTSTTSFNVYLKPSPVVDAGPDKFYLKGTSFTFTPVYSSNVRSYNWSPPDLLSCSDCAVPTGIANYRQKYILTVTSDSGCVAKDSVIINTECKTSDLYMPKAFTPNNDGRNDFYYPLTTTFRNISSFIIFNRQGKAVYRASNFPPNERSFGWDGRFEGREQSAGTYIFILEATCDIGEKTFIKGSFVLFR